MPVERYSNKQKKIQVFFLLLQVANLCFQKEHQRPMYGKREYQTKTMFLKSEMMI